MGPWIGTRWLDLHWDPKWDSRKICTLQPCDYGDGTHMAGPFPGSLWDPGLEPMGGTCIVTQNGTPGNFVHCNPVIMVMGHMWLGYFLGLYWTLDWNLWVGLALVPKMGLHKILTM